MPPGPRRISRTVRPAPMVPPVISSFANEPCGQRYAPLGAGVPTLPALEQPAAPKHFPFPSTPVDNDFFFECLLWFFALVTAGLQYLHLYRTVWWLPHSYTRQALLCTEVNIISILEYERFHGKSMIQLLTNYQSQLMTCDWCMNPPQEILNELGPVPEFQNFYLIDPYPVLFITVILSRRLVYMIGCIILNKILPLKIQKLAHYYLRIFLFCLLLFSLSFSTYFVMQNHQLEKMLYLWYPFFMYFIPFGFNIHPFFELINWSSATPPLHACSSEPSEIRKEVTSLITNFNCRLKEILFCAILNAYYAGFIPCCFAQPTLHYDILWSAQHIIFIFISSFIALSMHILSLRYCDILHRSALHLGAWEKLETGRTMLLVNNTWKEDILWPYGALVRYGKDIWRAQGDCNSSEPGNVGLKRFYYIFKNPTNTMGINLLVLSFMVLDQLIVLASCTYWYKIVSLTFILFFNYNILYQLLRDYLVCHKIYKEEIDMHKKINMR